MDTASVKLSIPEDVDAVRVLGGGDALLRIIEERTGARIAARGRTLSITGTPEEVEILTRLFTYLIKEARAGDAPTEAEVVRALQTLRESVMDISGFRDDILLTYRGKAIRPKTVGQKRYIDAIRSNTVTFCLGPAGTGKTYLAMAMAVAALKRHEVGRVVLTRPVVEAGESLGFLPGTLQEKIDPYVRPLFDALFDMTDMERGGELIEQGVIEIAPLAYMRGRTLNDAFVILDEAQNTTLSQIKMFLTRMGRSARFIVTGDLTQIDLARKADSGLSTVMKLLQGIDGIGMVEFDNRDIIRHRLVKYIVEAFDNQSKASEPELFAQDNNPERSN